MRFLWGGILLATACLARASGPNPFFSGETVTVDVSPAGVTVANSVLSRTISSSFQTTSLINNGVETLSGPSTEGVFTLPGSTVDIAGGTMLGADVIDAPDSKIVKIRGDKSGFGFTLCYRIFKGNRPWVVKWFEFDNPTDITSLAEERLRIKVQYVQSTYGEYAGSGIVAGGSGLIFGIQLNEMVPVAKAFRDGSGLNADVNILRPVSRTPDCILAICRGTRFSAAFALQVYWGTYVAHANPENRPVVFNTWYAYKWSVMDLDCYSAIPVLTDLGVDYFVVDDGWQDRYGDWNLNTTNFPTGLVGVANATRAAGMKFGFWISPASTKSNATNLNTNWLIKGFDQSIWTGLGWPVYCFSTPWNDYIRGRMVDLIQQTGSEFSKLDFTIERDYCFDPTHPHPPRGAQVFQSDNWKKFLAAVRDVDPNYQVYRAYTTAESCEYNDFGWWSDWVISELSDPRRKDARWWFRVADSTRYGTAYVRYLTPSWCLTGTTPAHIHTLENRQDVLDYNISSIVGQYCNLEFSNRVEEITPNESFTAKKWIRWFRKNQPYTMYSQFDDVAKRAYNAYDSSTYGTEFVDGAYHLRPKLNARYGYLCFWNPSEQPQQVTVNIKPEDYFLPPAIGQAKLHALNAGWEAVSAGPNLAVQFTMPPLSWEFVEVYDPTDPAYASDIPIYGRVHWTGLPIGSAGSETLDVRVECASGSWSETVPVDRFGYFSLMADMPRGPFSVLVKSSHWLRRRSNAINEGNPVSLDLVLVNGDAMIDNAVNVFDLSKILVDFDSAQLSSDLDLSGWVDVADLNTVLVNFGLFGD